jgi:hypothetical protein
MQLVAALAEVDQLPNALEPVSQRFGQVKGRDIEQGSLSRIDPNLVTSDYQPQTQRAIQ